MRRVQLLLQGKEKPQRLAVRRERKRIPPIRVFSQSQGRSAPTAKLWLRLLQLAVVVVCSWGGHDSQRLP